MAGNIIELINSYLTPDAVRKVADAVGETPAKTQAAMDGIVPSILAGLWQKVSGSSAPDAITGLIQDSKVDSGFLPRFADALSTGSLGTLLDAGSSAVSSIFGDKLSSVTDMISRSSGVSSNAASSLLSLGAPLVLGSLIKGAGPEGLQGGGFARLFAGSKDWILRNAPAGLSSVLSLSSLANLGAAPAAVRESVTAAAGRTSSLRWALPLALLALLLGWWFLRSVNPGPAMATIRLPDGATLSVREHGFLHNLSAYLGNPGDTEVPKRFTFDYLNFASASTTLTPESQETVTNLTAVLKAYPSAQIALHGHTDNTGDAAANKKLSLDRATVVRDILVKNGIGAERIVAVEGYGPDQPVASNDSEEGRSKNRRTDLEVVKK
jgi:outer membrane protein OmpA-like peptidoglycan-associated protein